MEGAKASPDGSRRAVIFKYLEAADAAKASRCGNAADWASESSTAAAEDDDLPVHMKSRELLENRQIVSTSIWMAAQQGTPKSKGSSTPTSAASVSSRCRSNSTLDNSFAAEDDMPMHQKSVERLEMRHIVSTSSWVASQGRCSSKLRTSGSQSEWGDLSSTAGSSAVERSISDPSHASLADAADAEAHPGSLQEERLADTAAAPCAVDHGAQDDERSTICAEEPDALSKPGSASSDSLPVVFPESLPAAPLCESPAVRGTIEVHCYAATGPNGQVVLDTVFMELLVLAKWQGIELRLHPSSYTSLPSLGELPVAFGGSLGRLERRDQVLAALRKLCCLGGGQGHPGNDTSDLRELMECDIAGPISELLWRHATVYEEYTWPVLLASSPGGFGRYWAWAERRRQLQKLPGEANPSSTFGRLASALDTLAARLGDGDSFQPEAAAVTPLDASAFAHLAVLFGIACKQGSQLKGVLTKHGNLAAFCVRLQERLNAWPCTGTFLAGVGA